jgi:hypothetical protein
MDALWKEIERLRATNAEHRSGFRLGEVTQEFILTQLEKEIQELMDAPDDIREFADVLGILWHYAQFKGWTMHEIEMQALMKLALRFDVPKPAK